MAKLAPVAIQQSYESIIYSQYGQPLPEHHTITTRRSNQCSILAAILSSGLKIQHLEIVHSWELGLPIEPNRSILVCNLPVYYHANTYSHSRRGITGLRQVGELHTQAGTTSYLSISGERTAPLQPNLLKYPLHRK